MRESKSTSMTPVGLLRRWVVDYFNPHDGAACRDFIEPDYALHIGDTVFAGRDEQWLPAVAAQMQLFPGLGMTVHQVIAGQDWVAAAFSEHGASQGRVACWSGVAIYKSNGTRLTGCVAQEDYMTRQRQLKSGVADAVDPPAAAPWDTAASPRNEAAEAVVTRWLKGSWPSAVAAVRCDDEHITRAPLQFDVASCEIGMLRSSGADVAFHVRQSGHYRGGFADVAPDARLATLDCNGIVRVEDGQVRSGRIIRDRVGLRARLRKAA